MKLPSNLRIVLSHSPEPTLGRGSPPVEITLLEGLVWCDRRWARRDVFHLGPLYREEPLGNLLKNRRNFISIMTRLNIVGLRTNVPHPPLLSIFDLIWVFLVTTIPLFRQSPT